MAISNIARTALALLVTVSASAALAGSHVRAIATPALGCTDRALIERADAFASNPKYEYDTLMRAAVGAGECRLLPAGMVVIGQDSDLIGPLVRVRPVGEPQAVWIVRNQLAEGEALLPASAGTRFPLPRR
jgi:hypothetical protein